MCLLYRSVAGATAHGREAQCRETCDTTQSLWGRVRRPLYAPQASAGRSLGDRSRGRVEWIAECIEFLGGTEIEADEAAEADWVEHVNTVANQTLYPRAASWYMGANIPGKPRVLMPYIGGVGAYRKRCTAVAANGYEGFVLSAVTA